MLLLLLSLVAFAGPVPDIQDNPRQLLKAAASQPAPQGFSVELLLDDLEISVGEDQVRVIHSRIYSIIEESPSFVINIHPGEVVVGRVVQPNGGQQVLTAQSDAEGRQFLVVPPLLAGAVIQTTAIESGARGSGAQAWQGRYAFVDEIPTRQIRVRVSWWDGDTVHYAGPRLGEAALRHKKGWTEASWTVNNVSPEPHSFVAVPTGSDVLRYIEVSTASDWASISKDLQAQSLQAAPQDAGVLKQNVSGTETEQMYAIARTVLARIKEEGHEGIRHADEVWAAQAGSKLERALVLTEALRASGFKADPAFVYTQDGTDIRADVPGGWLFNRVLVRAGPGLWLDPENPSGFLGIGLAGRQVLVAGESALSHIPAWQAADQQLQMQLEIDGLDRQQPQLVAMIGASGWLMDAIESGAADKPEDRSLGILSMSLSDATFSPTAVAGLPYGLQIHSGLLEAGFATALEASLVLPNPLLRLLPNIDASHRRLDIGMIPAQAEAHYRIHLPQGWEVSGLPKAMDQTIQGVHLKVQVKQSPEWLEIITSLDTGNGVISPDAFLAIQQVLEPQTQFTLEFRHPAAALIAAGKEGEALKLLLAESQAHPKDANAALRYGIALRRLGLVSMARVELKRAVALDPNLKRAWREYGIALATDPYGRLLRGEFSREEAIKALKVAVEKDAKDTVARQYLFAALAQDTHGQLAGEGVQVGEALKVLEGMDLGSVADWIRSRALSLRLYFRQDQALLDTPVGNDAEGLRFQDAARSAMVGPTAALSQIQGAGRDLQPAVEGAIGALIGARRYEDARALAQAAAPQLRTTADALGGLMQRTEAAALGNDALSAVKHFYLSMYEGLNGKETALSFLSKDSLHTQDNWDAFHQFYNADMIPGVNADIGFQSTQFEAKDGDEKGMEVVTTRNQRSLSFYMVKEGNDWKIRAMGWESEEIAREARQLLEAGDKAAAGRWLGWLVNLEVDNPKLPFMQLYSAKEDSRWGVALAAFLAPYGDTAAIKLLEAQDRSKDIEGAPMGLALFWAYMHQKDYTHAEKILSEIQAKLEAKTYQELHWSLWEKQENLGSLEKELLSALEKDPKDVQLLYRLAKVYSKRADYAGVVRVQQQIQQSGKASPHDLNNLVWFSLYVSPLPPDAEAKARAAWKQSPDESARHTLACVLVAVGKTEEARQLLIEHLDAGHLDAPEPAWWYVIGQMQERLGMPQMAITAYTSVLAEDGETAELARRRLAALKP